MSHYYDEKQDSPLRERKTIVRLFNKEYSFLTASGLFSKDHIDNATKLLINKCDLTKAKKVLDLGCGWGSVSTILADQNPSIEFFASDINMRAITYTRKNTRANKVTVDVKKSNILKNWEDETFDVILTNPPYSAGRKICFAFIEESFEKLNIGGSLQLVARHQKGGKALGLHMEEIFKNMEILSIKSGFRIYKSVKK